MKLNLDYFRACPAVSCLALLASSLAWSQTPAQAAKKAKEMPTLRAVAVLEWTGDDEAKPKKSRLVPISIYDGKALEDASLYLARPEPLAVAGEVEYQLKQNGKTTGLFVIKNAAQEEGSWVGYGEWKPAPAAKPLFAATAPRTEDENDGDEKPTLHRKRHDDDSADSTSKSKDDSKSGDDTDRPTLHRKTGGDTSSSSGTAASAPPSDQTSDLDRPVMKKSKAKKEEEDISHSSALPGVTDPDRPRLVRGQDTSQSLKVLPSLMGLPADMRQTVGVSDQKDHPDHPWSYTWANPDDEARMKAALEEQARQALGLATPPPATHHTAAGKSAGKSTASKSTAAKKPVHPAPAAPIAPASLEDEQFRVFELAYGSGATLVFSAHTAGEPKERKYVTIIAQPDLYGSLFVLYKSVAEAGRLDQAPRMILVDAVDALADNRGELLFELRGATQRQFALYRILRGTAERIFITGPAEFGSMATATE